MAAVGGGGAPFTLTDSIVIDLITRNQALFAGLEQGAAAMTKFTNFVFSWRGALTGSLAVVAISLVKVGRQAVATASVIDTALREVATLLPQSSKQLTGLRDSIIGLSTRLPQPPELLTKGFYQIVSAGITDTAEAFTVLEASARAAVAGLTTTFTAADAITTALNAFQLAATDAGRVSDIFFETVRVGKLRFEDIQSSLGDVVSSAALVGVSLEELSGALATLTQFGISADEAATSLNRTFLAVVNATEDERAAAKSLGFDLDSTALRTKGLVGFMQQLNEATDANVDALAAIFPEIRAFRGVSILAGEGIAKLASNVAAITQGAGATQDALEEIQGAQTSLNARLRNQLGAIFARIGNDLLPVVNKVMGTFIETLETAEDREIGFAEALGRSNEALALRRQLLNQQRIDQLSNLEAEIQDRLDNLRTEITQTLFGTGSGAGQAIQQLGTTGLPEELQQAIDILRDQLPQAVATGDQAVEVLLTHVQDLIEETRRTGENAGIDFGRFGGSLLGAQKIIEDLIRDMRIARTLAREIRFSEPSARAEESLRLAQQLLDLTRDRADATEEDIKNRRLAVQLAEQEKDLVAEQQRLEGTISAIQALRARTGTEGLSLLQVQGILEAELQTGQATESRLNLLRALIAALQSEEGSQQAIELIQKNIARTLAGEIITQREFNKEVDNTDNKFAGLVKEIRTLKELGGGFATEITNPLLQRAIKLLNAGFNESDQTLDGLVDRFKAINDLLREARLVSEFRLDFQITDAGPELQDALDKIRDIDDELEKIGTDFSSLDERTRNIAQGRVERLRQERQELADEVNDLRGTLRGELTKDALAAADQISELAAARVALSQIGLDIVGELPDDVLQLGTEIADLGEKIDTSREALDKLEETQNLVRNAALAAADAYDVQLAAGLTAVSNELGLLIDRGREEIASLEEQKRVAEEAARSLEPFRDLLGIFPELQDETLLALTEAQRRFLAGQTEALQGFRQARDEAVANVRIVRAEFEAGVASADDLRKAEEAAKLATERFKRALGLVAQGLRAAGIQFKPIADLLDQLSDGLDDATKKSSGLTDALNTAARALQGLVSAVDGLDLLSEGLTDALRGAVDLAQGLAAISTDPIGGIFQAVGGAVGVISGLFGGGESEADRKRREALEKNTAALEGLTVSMGDQEQLIRGLTGRQIQALEILASQPPPGIAARRTADGQVQGPAQVIQDTIGRLEDLGLSIDDIRAIAEAANLELPELEKFFKGLPVDFAAIADELGALQKIAEDGLTGLMQRLIDEFDEKQRLLSQQQSLFREEFEADPSKFIKTFQQNLAEALGGEVGAQLLSFDVTDPQGRRDLLAFLKELFTRGLVDPTVLGSFDPEGFRDAVVEFADAVRDFGDSSETGTLTTGGVVKTISEVTGNRIVGALTTISVIEQLQLAVLREILLELGGTLPENVQTISFRAPGTELDILEIEQQQLDVLQSIEAILGTTFGFVDTTGLRPPTEAEVAALNPNPVPIEVGGPTLQVLPGAFAAGSIVINDPIATPEAAASFVDQVFPALNQRFATERRADRRARGQPGGLQ